MDEILKSIKAFLYDRTVSPLFGAFVTAWSFWNYQIYIAIFDGDAAFETKLEFLSKYFGPQIKIVGDTLYISGWFSNGICWPTLFTWSYLYVYPPIAKIVYQHSLKNQMELREVKQSIEKHRLLSTEESRKLISEIEQLRLKTDKEVKEYRERISSLTQTIEELEKQINGPLTDSYNTANNYTQFDADNLFKRISKKIDRLAVGEFQLRTLFDNDEEWDSQTETQKRLSESYFAEWVAKNRFEGISPSRRIEDLIFYVKGNPLDSRSSLATKEYLHKLAPTPTPETEELINKISDYCLEQGVSIEMVQVLRALSGERQTKFTEEISNTLKKSGLTNIEIDHLFNKMQKKELISEWNKKTSLTKHGQEFVVESGLITFSKIINS